MKTIIVCQSYHHGNTEKLANAIAEKYDVEVVPTFQAKEMDLSEYDCIGIASGVAFGRFYPEAEDFARYQLPDHKDVFFLYTCGTLSKKYTENITASAREHHSRILGSYGCRGFDTYGPFKVIGGIAKGHPTEEEIERAAAFYEKITAGR